MNTDWYFAILVKQISCFRVPYIICGIANEKDSSTSVGMTIRGVTLTLPIPTGALRGRMIAYMS